MPPDQQAQSDHPVKVFENVVKPHLVDAATREFQGRDVGRQVRPDVHDIMKLTRKIDIDVIRQPLFARAQMHAERNPGVG